MLRSGRGGADPPPYGQPDRKISVFFWRLPLQLQFSPVRFLFQLLFLSRSSLSYSSWFSSCSCPSFNSNSRSSTCSNCNSRSSLSSVCSMSSICSHWSSSWSSISFHLWYAEEIVVMLLTQKLPSILHTFCSLHKFNCKTNLHRVVSQISWILTQFPPFLPIFRFASYWVLWKSW